jgi:UDP-sulfoquinovose synthase
MEAEEHYYNPEHTGLMDLGLKPHYLTDEIISDMIEFANNHKEKIRLEQIYRKVRWDQNRG